MSDSTVRNTPERRVLGELGNAKAEPISPTANLRLLTTLASNLKSASDEKVRAKPGGGNAAAQGEASPDPFKLLPRKEKSLGLLCNKFLSLYPLSLPDGVPREISLDSTAKALATEKRRIYDIINVLESLEMASKAGKNRYLWHGHTCLPATLAKLKSLAIKLGLREQIREIQKISRAYTGERTEGSPSSSTTPTSVSQSPTTPDDGLADSGIREDKSLGIMCQKFIMLFLVSLRNGVINLDIAAKVLIADSEQPAEVADANLRSRFKTKVRRLYDIANVLTAIGLIRKVSMCDGTIRKPVFSYTGPDVDYVDLDAETPVREGTRHSLIGTLTPNESFTRSSFPRCCGDSMPSTPKRIFASSANASERWEPRKRKLFGPDDTFPRTQSSPCIKVQQRSTERLDDSILQVAEMELKRLKSCESLKPKISAKLLSRHYSDSSIPTTQESPEFGEHSRSSEVGKIASGAFCEPSMSTTNAQAKSASTASGRPLAFVSKENLVRANVREASPTCRSASIVNLPVRVNVYQPRARLPVADSAVRCVQSKRGACSSSLKLKIRDHNIPDVRGVLSKGLMINDVAADDKKVVRIAPYNVQPKINAPKFVTLASFDAKKLVPVRASDLKVSLSPFQPVAVESSTIGATNFAILTQVPTQTLSPGDMFKAVKVGNTLRLVPLRDDKGDAGSTDHDDNATKSGS